MSNDTHVRRTQLTPTVNIEAPVNVVDRAEGFSAADDDACGSTRYIIRLHYPSPSCGLCNVRSGRAAITIFPPGMIKRSESRLVLKDLKFLIAN